MAFLILPDKDDQLTTWVLNTEHIERLVLYKNEADEDYTIDIVGLSKKYHYSFKQNKPGYDKMVQHLTDALSAREMATPELAVGPVTLSEIVSRRAASALFEWRKTLPNDDVYPSEAQALARILAKHGLALVDIPA
jgi:hypothetical protein